MKLLSIIFILSSAFGAKKNAVGFSYAPPLRDIEQFDLSYSKKLKNEFWLNLEATTMSALTNSLQLSSPRITTGNLLRGALGLRYITNYDKEFLIENQLEHHLFSHLHYDQVDILFYNHIYQGLGMNIGTAITRKEEKYYYGPKVIYSFSDLDSTQGVVLLEKQQMNFFNFSLEFGVYF